MNVNEALKQTALKGSVTTRNVTNPLGQISASSARQSKTRRPLPIAKINLDQGVVTKSARKLPNPEL